MKERRNELSVLDFKFRNIISRRDRYARSVAAANADVEQAKKRLDAALLNEVRCWRFLSRCADFPPL
jgi:hypothetical protein